MKKAVCWLLVFLLTGTLVLLGFSGVFSLAAAPALREGGTPVPQAVREEEAELIRARVNDLGDIYGFAPESAMKAVTPEILDELNEQAAAWWNAVLTEGRPGAEPEWDLTDLRNGLREDPALTEGMDTERAEETVYAAADAVGKTVVRTVLPMRQNLMILALTKVGQRIDIPDLIRFGTGVPWAMLAACLLLSGVVALLESRRLTESLKYLGSAAGAAALVTAATLILIFFAPFSGLIGEASASLQAQYDALLSDAVIRLGAWTASLLILCGVCLGFWIRGARRAGKARS